MDGSWKATFPCSTNCTEGNGKSDSFVLDLWSSGARLCGTHLATAHLGNRVDEIDDADAPPSILGSIEGTVAEVTFKSGWGGSGHATIRVVGDQLRWQLAGRGEGTFWFPSKAVLMREHTDLQVQEWLQKHCANRISDQLQLTPRR
jgi:hypothetical protein